MIGDGMRRVGQDLFLEATVPVWTALLGAEMQWGEVAGAENAAAFLSCIRVPQGVTL
jgi:hypothetical protein